MGTAGFGLVLLAVPLVTFNALRATPNMTYGDLPLALSAALLLAVWLRSGLPRGTVPAGFAAGVLLLAAGGVLAIVPADAAGSLVPTSRFVVTLALMPLIVMLAASTPARVHMLVDAWLVAAAINSVVAASDLLGATRVGLSLTSLDFVTYTDRAPGLTGHPNHLGLVAAMALPVAVSRLGAGGVRGLAALIFVPLLIMGVGVSGSRGAFIAAAAGIVMLFAFEISTRRARTTLLLFGAPVVTFVLVVSMLGNNELAGSVTIERLRGGAGAGLSDEQRRQTLKESLEEALAHPIVGAGFAEVRTAHNIYIQLLQAGGLLALAGFASFAAAIIRRARWLAHPARGSPRWLTSLASGCGASVSVWLLFGMVGNAVYDRYLYIPVGMTLALALVHKRWCVGSESPSAEPPLSTLARDDDPRATRLAQNRAGDARSLHPVAHRAERAGAAVRDRT